MSVQESKTERFVSQIFPEEATGDLLVFYRSLLTRRGRVPELYQCLGLRPDLLVSIADLAQKAYLNKGALSLQTRERIAAFVRGLIHYPEASRAAYSPLYLQSANDAVLGPLSDGDLDLATKSGLQESERALLELVAVLFKGTYRLTVNDLDRVRSEGWSDQAIFEAVFDAALFGLFVHVVSAFGISYPSLDLETAGAETGAPGSQPLGVTVSRESNQPRFRSTWSF